MAKSTNSPQVIDLFSGVGGLSLGAARAGFNVVSSVELDPIASASHFDNFPNTRHSKQDVSKLAGSELLSHAGLKKNELAGLVGGPPCQGFSSIGQRNVVDARNDLFSHFFRLVSETSPAFFLAENVPGILAPQNKSIIDAALSLIPSKYNVLAPIKVRANLYGAPTTRTRIFFIGFDRRKIDVLTEEMFLPDESVATTNVETALRGLPSVREHWQREDQSWRKVKDLPESDFYNRVRNAIPLGVGSELALRMLSAENRVSGFLGTAHSEETIARFDALEPGEVDPVYRSRRLVLSGFCPTIRAGTGSDRGSFQAVRPIHPKSPRVISPREAARLQGFPDWFVFHPTKWHSFRQIGNSVSPIVAEAILRPMKDALR